MLFPPETSSRSRPRDDGAGLPYEEDLTVPIPTAYHAQPKGRRFEALENERERDDGGDGDDDEDEHMDRDRQEVVRQAIQSFRSRHVEKTRSRSISSATERERAMEMDRDLSEDDELGRVQAERWAHEQARRREETLDRNGIRQLVRLVIELHSWGVPSLEFVARGVRPELLAAILEHSVASRTIPPPPAGPPPPPPAEPTPAPQAVSMEVDASGSGSRRSSTSSAMDIDMDEATPSPEIPPAPGFGAATAQAANQAVHMVFGSAGAAGTSATTNQRVLQLQDVSGAAVAGSLQSSGLVTPLSEISTPVLGASSVPNVDAIAKMRAKLLEAKLKKQKMRVATSSTDSPARESPIAAPPILQAEPALIPVTIPPPVSPPQPQSVPAQQPELVNNSVFTQASENEINALLEEIIAETSAAESASESPAPPSAVEEEPDLSFRPRANHRRKTAIDFEDQPPSTMDSAKFFPAAKPKQVIRASLAPPHPKHFVLDLSDDSDDEPEPAPVKVDPAVEQEEIDRAEALRREIEEKQAYQESLNERMRELQRKLKAKKEAKAASRQASFAMGASVSPQPGSSSLATPAGDMTPSESEPLPIAAVTTVQTTVAAVTATTSAPVSVATKPVKQKRKKGQSAASQVVAMDIDANEAIKTAVEPVPVLDSVPAIVVEDAAEVPAKAVIDHSMESEPEAAATNKAPQEKVEGFSRLTAIEEPINREVIRAASPPLFEKPLLSEKEKTARFTRYDDISFSIPNAVSSSSKVHVGSTSAVDKAAKRLTGGGMVHRQTLESITWNRVMLARPDASLCKFEASGTCSDPGCESLHLSRDLVPTQQDLLKLLNIVIPSNAADHSRLQTMISKQPDVPSLVSSKKKKKKAAAAAAAAAIANPSPSTGEQDSTPQPTGEATKPITPANAAKVAKVRQAAEARALAVEEFLGELDGVVAGDA